MPPDGWKSVSIRKETYEKLTEIMVAHDLDSVAEAAEVAANVTDSVSGALPQS